MNFRLVREFATLVSAHGAEVVESDQLIAESALGEFWDQARRQSGRWSTFLEKSADVVDRLSESARKQTWHSAETVLSEVFGLDMLTRVWSTILVAHDIHHGVKHAAPVASSVMSTQRHLRHLCLSLMVNWSPAVEPRLAVVDRFRRRVERWTDVLIGHLASKYGVADFAFDANRSLEFGSDQLQGDSLDASSPVWRLVQSGMSISFPDSSVPRTGDGQQLNDLVKAVASGVPLHLSRPGKPFASFVAQTLPAPVAQDEPDDVPRVLPISSGRHASSVGLSFTDLRSRRS